MDGRDAQGRMKANAAAFPDGIAGVATYIHSLGLKLGVYSAASSVVCSGRVGSLYNEAIDAQTFAEWGVDLVKYDNCGEYGLGNARFVAFADAVNATGRQMMILTEPFLLVPTTSHASFANAWRTTNDINANFGTILDRSDSNDKWADIHTSGAVNDPDMLEIGNGGLTDGESRVHFGLWSLMKSPLILGTNLSALTPSKLAIVSNKAVISINQDALTVQGKKLAVNGLVTPRFVGLAPCETGAERGYNGVSRASLAWSASASAVNASALMLTNTETGRCLTMGAYYKYPAAPLLLPCNASDPAQAWLLPSGAATLGALLSLPAVLAGAPATALAVGDSTLYSGLHGNDAVSVPDSSYGLLNLTLAPYVKEAPCNNRGCDDYEPSQMWYWSPRLGTLNLGHMSANDYHCFGPNCYQLTRHLPTMSQMCLAHTLSFDANVGTSPNDSGAAGVDVWGGPLSGGDFVMGFVNRDNAAAHAIAARWAWLEAPGVGDATSFCATELFSGAALGQMVGGASVTVPPHDMALVRLTPGSAC
jgi:alpha-galactosidase